MIAGISGKNSDPADRTAAFGDEFQQRLRLQDGKVGERIIGHMSGYLCKYQSERTDPNY